MKGSRIVITRAAEQAQELATPLRELGAEVIILPAIAIVPTEDPTALRQSARGAYDWIVFTSTNAVKAFAAVTEARKGARIACVGVATAALATAYGFEVALTPAQYTAESMLPLMPADMHSQRVLIPRSALARDIIPEVLRQRGAEVTVIEAYRNILPAETVERAPSIFATPPDWVLFASSSAVENIFLVVGAEALTRSRLGSIGPVTSASIRKHGLEVALEADPHTVTGLVEGLKRFYAIMQER